MSEFITIILAAGKGTRMKSPKPKVLHSVGGKPMVEHVLTAAEKAGAAKNILVIGFGAESVREIIGARVHYAVQAEQLGTGHAVMQAKDALDGFNGTIMVLCGDTPLLRAPLLKKLFEIHKNTKASATVLTAKMPDPTGYGRVIRAKGGNVIKIVEQKDALAEELIVDEINTGMYCFESQALFSKLNNLTCDNAQGEYYLTDVIGLLVADGQKVSAATADDYLEVMGVNSRVQQSEAEKILWHNKAVSLMESGVTILDPDSTFIGEDVIVAPDSVIYPFTWIEGASSIGANCEIGPSSRISDTAIGDNVIMQFTYAHECKIGNNVNIGPYVHLRPHTVLGDGVKLGNFVEVKNSNVGSDSKVPHLSYIGDTDMGSGVNIGSGTITVNYDGRNKYRTTIENNVFVGCNSNLIAPVTLGENSYIAAGSTITKNVSQEALGVARAKQSNIDGWAKKRPT